MKVIFAAGRIKKKFLNSIVAIGVFDGVHRGHRHVISKMVRRAKALKQKSVVITFFPLPVHVLYPQISVPFIISLEHRLNLIEQLGADVCVVLKFSKEFSKVTAGEFVAHHLVESFHPCEIYVGHNFRFGENRGGDVTFLAECGKKYGFKVHSIASVKRHGRVVSSTRIRKLIAAHQLDQAKELLGRPFSIYGRVVRGDNRGKKIGFPTANVKPNFNTILPRGVYAAKTIVKDKANSSMVNIGERPSFQKPSLTVEAHLFNFNKNIYGQNIEIQLLKKLRSERTFSSPQALIRQLQKDARLAKNAF